jgi:hypothetical protein
MKKQLLIASLLAVATSFSAFGQGFINDSAGAGTVKNGVTGLNQAGTEAILFAPVGTSDPLGAGMAQSGLTTATKPWSTVTGMLTSGWTLGKISGVEADGTVSGAAFGGGSFAFGAGTVQIDGWSSINESVVVIAWYGAQTTLSTAATANDMFGWSTAFTVVSGASSTDPNGTVNFSGQTTPISPFGVALAPVPEPTTLALAGLGGAALLAIRRRKA